MLLSKEDIKMEQILSEIKNKKNNGRLGKKLSQETKDKISRSNLGKILSQETKDKLRNAHLGKKQSQETIQKRVSKIDYSKISVCLKGYKQSKEQIVKRVSKINYKEVGRKTHETMKLRGTNVGEKNPMYGKKCPKIPIIYYKDYIFRSYWEYKLARILEYFDIKFLYEPERFYFADFTYVPDFYLPKYNLYIEVKGWMNEISIKKIQEFRRNHNLLVLSREMKGDLYSIIQGVFQNVR